MTYRCAFLGCGPRANGHAAAYERITRGTRVACCDLDPERVSAFGERHHIAARYTDLDEMLSRERPDVVHMVTKPTIRYALMKRLSDAGVPAVIVEKPACIGADDYAALRGLAATSKTRFVVNLQLRYHPVVLDFLARIHAGQIGTVRMIDATAGLPMAGQGVHILDLMFAFNGYVPPRTVFAAGSGYDDIDGTHPSPRTVSSAITFENGTRGLLQAGEGYPILEPDPAPWMHKRIAVYGTHGYLHWRMGGWERSLPDGSIASGPLDYGAEDIVGQANLTEAVFDWLEDPTAVAPTALSTALDEWLVVLASYQSIIESRPVEMPFDPPSDLLEQFQRHACVGG